MKKKTRKAKIGDTVPGMDQAAALLGTSKGVIREAKRQGCQAFRANQNVHIPTLKRWLAKHEIKQEDEPKSKSEARYAKAKADRMEIVVAEKKRNVIPVHVMRQSFTRAVIATKARFCAIPDNCAQRFAVMQDPIEIREALRVLINEALAEMAKCEWMNKAA